MVQIAQHSPPFAPIEADNPKPPLDPKPPLSTCVGDVCFFQSITGVDDFGFRNCSCVSLRLVTEGYVLQTVMIPTAGII